MEKILSFSNIGKKSNKTWKYVSKMLCRVLPVVAGAVISIPIPEVVKLWIIFGCTVITAIVSAVSELTIDTTV